MQWRLDWLANAGGPPSATFMELTDVQWQGAVRLNMLSAVWLAHEALPYMKKQGWGRIVNMASVAVKQPIDGLMLSNAVRAGVIGFAKTLANELATDNILVNNVCPATFSPTEFWSLLNFWPKNGRTLRNR